MASESPVRCMASPMASPPPKRMNTPHGRSRVIPHGTIARREPSRAGSTIRRIAAPIATPPSVRPAGFHPAGQLEDVTHTNTAATKMASVAQPAGRTGGRSSRLRGGRAMPSAGSIRTIARIATGHIASAMGTPKRAHAPKSISTPCARR